MLSVWNCVHVIPTKGWRGKRLKSFKMTFSVLCRFILELNIKRIDFRTQKTLDMHLRRGMEQLSNDEVFHIYKENKRPEVEGENREGKERERRMFFFPLQLFPLIFTPKQSWWTQQDTKENVTKVIPKLSPYSLLFLSIFSLFFRGLAENC